MDKVQILKDLKKSLSKHLNENLIDIILFGSQLKNKNNQDSDYDILIFVRNKIDWKLEREISDICFEIDLKYGILSDTHILSEEELSTPRGKQPFFINALKQGLYA